MKARHSMMDILARREHSEKELREKLAGRFTPEEIDDAIEHARANKWLAPAEAMAGRLANELHRKSKGILAINHKLREKGLPAIAEDPVLELEKALRLAETKRSSDAPPDQAERERIGRFLIARGFEPSIVRKVVHEKL